jgi:hypothetical protein
LYAPASISVVVAICANLVVRLRSINIRTVPLE